MTPDIILHIARDDYARNIVETGDNAGFKAGYGGTREFTAAMKKMGWESGQGWCNYWANSVWWRAYAPSLPDELLPIFRRSLDELLQEKDSLRLWQEKSFLEPLRRLEMESVYVEEYKKTFSNEIKYAFPGSLVMFSCSDDDDNEKGSEDHIGIGLEIGMTCAVCIEGNAGDALRITHRSWASGKILGWITPMQIFPEWNNYTLPE